MTVFKTDLLPSESGYNLGSDSQRWNGFFQTIDIGGDPEVIANHGCKIIPGVGDPVAQEVDAQQGSIYLRMDGDAATTLYIKTGPAVTDWTAK